MEYLAAQGPVILRYFRLFLLPWGFTIDPDIRVARWEEVLAWAVLASTIFFASRFARPGIWFLSGILLLIPSSSIFPAADLAADRRMYLPMVAFCAALGVLVNSLVKKPSPILVALVAFVLVALSIRRMEVWRTEQSLWREAVERSPEKPRPRIQLARAVPPAEALDVLRPAPMTADVVTERGRVYLDLGSPADALREFGRALALRPGDAHAINNRGVALLALGQKEAARRDFNRALTIDPALQDARQNLARITAAER
jgi:tetratricopeptide (TPR) repeat protein